MLGASLCGSMPFPDCFGLKAVSPTVACKASVIPVVDRVLPVDARAEGMAEAEAFGITLIHWQAVAVHARSESALPEIRLPEVFR